MARAGEGTSEQPISVAETINAYEADLETRGGRKYSGNVAIAGDWPPVSPPPAHDTLREHEAHHPEPAFAD